MQLNLAERVLALLSLELTCFGEASLAVGAQSCFFPQTSSDLFGDVLAYYK